MAHAAFVSVAFASPAPSVDIPKTRDAVDATHDAGIRDKMMALLTPPNSVSPEFPPHVTRAGAHSPPPMDIENETGAPDAADHALGNGGVEPETSGVPLSKGALSGLDAAHAITPGMLARHHLPEIMLGSNGPKPIRYVIGELTQTVPGFSRIPPAKARRLVVAALESRGGGGPDGNVEFAKVGWGRWDAHFKPHTDDPSGGNDLLGHPSPPESERCSHSPVHHAWAIHVMPDQAPPGVIDETVLRDDGPKAPRDLDDDFDIDMHSPENEADKMSMDGTSMDYDLLANDTEGDDDDDEMWRAPRKASLPPPDAPRKDYNAISASYSSRWPPRSWSRRPSGISGYSYSSKLAPFQGALDVTAPATASLEERAAATALLQMGSL